MISYACAYARIFGQRYEKTRLQKRYKAKKQLLSRKSKNIIFSTK